MMKNSTVTTPKVAQEKWERELRIEGVSWHCVFKWVYEITNDFKLRWLQLRILHRILVTNKMSCIFDIRDSGACERCSEPSESILHVFWECPFSRHFWLDF